MLRVHLKKWLPLVVIGILMLAAWIFDLHHIISFENFKEHKGDLSDYVLHHPLASAAIFVISYTISVALSLPIASLLTFIGGFLFGQWWGTFYVVIAATIGAAIVFLVAKSSMGECLRRKAGPMYDKAAKEMNENALSYLFGLRLAPIFPFFIVNILPALFNVPLRIYVLTTFFGILPGSFVYVNVGRALGEVDALGDLVSSQMFFAFMLLGAFSFAPVLYKKIKVYRSVTVKTVAIFIASFGLMHSAEAQPRVHTESYASFISSYATLLKAYVRPAASAGIEFQGVDYDEWSKNTLHQSALRDLLQTDPKSFHTSTEKMAYWINVYNMLTIDLIVQTKERKSIKNLGSLFSSPWKAHKWKIKNREYSLDDIEHEILRPMGDSRIHFAVNCASVSCPDLRQEPYTSEKLDEQLNDQVKLTLGNKGKGLTIEEDKKTIYLTKITEWYKSDFDNGDLLGWLRKYVKLPPNEGLKIKFLTYNWALNKVAR